MDILYITPEAYNTTRRTGGMGTKTNAMIKGWSNYFTIETPNYFDVEYFELHDVILIELLGLRNEGKLEERVQVLKQASPPKLVYGSDSEIFRWSGKDLKLLNSVVSGWIANCQWQQDYFMDFDLPVFGVLYEPIDTDLFRPSQNPEKIIVTGGRISHEKDAEFYIDLFKALKPIKKDYQTEYIGSAGGWNDYEPQNLRLEHELKPHVDIFHGEIEQSRVAGNLGKAAVGIFSPVYETCHRLGMELAASGKPRICGKHRLYDEKITQGRFDSVETCIEALKELTNDFTELPDPQHGVELRQFALDNYSYNATTEQLHKFVRYVI